MKLICISAWLLPLIAAVNFNDSAMLAQTMNSNSLEGRYGVYLNYFISRDINPGASAVLFPYFEKDLIALKPERRELLAKKICAMDRAAPAVWGAAWRDHLEGYEVFLNQIPLSASPAAVDVFCAMLPFRSLRFSSRLPDSKTALAIAAQMNSLAPRLSADSKNALYAACVPWYSAEGRKGIDEYRVSLRKIASACRPKVIDPWMLSSLLEMRRDVMLRSAGILAKNKPAEEELYDLLCALFSTAVNIEDALLIWTCDKGETTQEDVVSLLSASKSPRILHGWRYAQALSGSVNAEQKGGFESLKNIADDSACFFAYRYLRLNNPAPAESLLFSLCDNTKPFLASAALIDLAATTNAAVLQKIYTFQRTPYALTAMCALNASQAAGKQYARSFYLSMLEHPSLKVRHSSLWAVMRFGDAASTAPVLKHLDDEDELTRILCAKTLGHLKDKRALPALEAIQKNPLAASAFKREAAEALIRINEP